MPLLRDKKPRYNSSNDKKPMETTCVGIDEIPTKKPVGDSGKFHPNSR